MHYLTWKLELVSDILWVIVDTPKKVTLPNCRTFYAKYQRVSRSQLSPNVIMKRKIKEEEHQKVEDEDQWERGKEVEVFSVV